MKKNILFFITLNVLSFTIFPASQSKKLVANLTPAEEKNNELVKTNAPENIDSTSPTVTKELAKWAELDPVGPTEESALTIHRPSEMSLSSFLPDLSNSAAWLRKWFQSNIQDTFILERFSAQSTLITRENLFVTVIQEKKFTSFMTALDNSCSGRSSRWLDLAINESIANMKIATDPIEKKQHLENLCQIITETHQLKKLSSLPKDTIEKINKAIKEAQDAIKAALAVRIVTGTSELNKLQTLLTDISEQPQPTITRDQITKKSDLILAEIVAFVSQSQKQ